MKQSFRQMAALAAVVLVLGTTAAPLAAQAAGTDVAWNVACPVSHFAPDDPIVYPGKPGLSHMHAFYGNESTDAATTTQSLLAASSSCTRGFANTDHSSYWIPALYRHAAGGLQLISGSPYKLEITVYYRRGGGNAGPKVTPFPQGLRMIAGNAKATAPQDMSITAWRCSNGGGNFSPRSSSIPTCGGGQNLSAKVTFPSCWDGHNLDSADHMSHMAYPSGKGSACPADHPVKLPAVTYSISYRGVNGDSSQYELSSGGQYSMHGDFFAAWDNQVQSALVNSCLNVGRKCTGIHRDQVNVAAATTGSGGQVLGASTSAADPAASPAADPSAAKLPVTGPFNAWTGALGVTAVALAGYWWRRGREDLRAVLRGK